MKRILTICLYLFIGLLLALVLIPYVFKDKIVAMVKESVNENVNAKVDFDDVDISLIRSFPKARLTLKGINVVGIDTFDGVPLLKAKNVFVETNITPLFNKQVKPVISYFEANEADINLLVLNKQQANYLITKPSGDTSKIVFDIESYALNNSKLSYRDETMPMTLTMSGVNHSGKGSIIGNIYNLVTSTDIDSLSTIYDGYKYLSEVPAAFDINMLLNLDEAIYDFTEIKGKLKNLPINGNAKIKILDDDRMEIDAQCNVNKAPFKQFVEVLPMIRQDKTYNASGNLNFSLNSKGIYNSKTLAYPSFDIKSNLDDGMIKYVDLPYALKPAKFKVEISSTKANLADLKIQVPTFEFGINNDKISGNLLMNRATQNPRVSGKVIGNLNLDNWAKAIALKDVEVLKGLVKSNIEFDTDLSSIEQSKYELIKFNGQMDITNLDYKVTGQPDLMIGNLQVAASPQIVKVNAMNTSLGKSKMDINAQIADPLAIFSTIKKMSGSVTVKSDFIDLDEFNTNSTSANESTNVAAPLDLKAYEDSNVKLDLDVKKIKYTNLLAEDVKIKGDVSLSSMKIDAMNAKIGKSDIALNGLVENAYDYLFNNEILRGDIVLKSSYLDANQFMTAEPQANPNVNMPVPQNVKLNIAAQIGTLLYTNLTIKNIDGTINVADEKAVLNGIAGDVLGGKIGFDGMYESKDLKNPNFNVKLDLQKVKMEEAYEKFESMKVLAPIAKYIKGYLNTTLVMNGKLDTAMTPQYQSLNASGFIETINSAIKNSKILDEISDKLGIQALKNIDLETSRNWFEVVNGQLELKEKTFKIKDVEVRTFGKHTLKGPMDYNLFFKIPRSYMQKDAKLKVADKGLDWLSKEAGKLGVDIANGEFLDIQVKINGTHDKPQLKFIPMGTSGKTLKEEMTQKVDDLATKAKDSVKTVINDNKKKVEDTIRTRLSNELESAKDKAFAEAEKRANEAKDKAGSVVKKEVESRVDSAFGKGVTDTLRNKANEVLKKNTNTSVDELKNKLKDFNPFKKTKNGN